jgi:hypothetical protein
VTSDCREPPDKLCAVLATPAIGKGIDFCVCVAEQKRAYSSNGDGTLTAVGEKAGKYAAGRRW